MKTQKTILGFFALLALIVLSVSAVDAQTSSTQNCLTVTPVNFPTSVINTQNTFQATLNIAFGPSPCANDRTINSVDLSSVFSGSTANVGSWSVSNTLPITINATTNNPTLVTATFTIPSSGTGMLVTTLTINATSTSGTTVSTFTNLPDINITAPTPTLTIQTPATPVEFGQNTTITVTNTGTTTLSNIILTSTPTGVIFNPASITSLTGGATSNPINLLLNALTNLKFGFNNVQVKAQSGTVEATSNFQIKKTFCKEGEAGGNLKIKDLKIDNLDGDDDTWQIFDEIEVIAEIENTGTEDIDDILVELGLFSSGSDFADDLDWISSDETEVDLGKINDGKKKKATFSFRVPAEFAERGNENYMLAVKAYSEDLNEENECVDSNPSEFSDDFFESIDVEVEDDEERFVVVHDIQMPSQATCSETISGQFKVSNIGEDVQERVRITMKNSDLNIDQEFTITRDLDIGDSKTLFFSFTVPSNAPNKLHTINFRTEYDYDNGFYDVTSEETFKGIIDVLGCSGTVPLGNTGGSNAIITARLISDAIPGEILEIEATITNSGTETATYTIGASEFSSWASLDEISDSTVTLNSGESKKVTIKLNVNDDVTGSKSFTIQTTSQGRISSQEVEVNFGNSRGFSFNFGGNNLIWIIAIVNVVLILLIIFVAIRLSRR